MKLKKGIAVLSLTATILCSAFIVPSSSNPTVINSMAKTTTRSLTKKLSDKKCYVGLGYAGCSVKTTNWKSSNSSIATVSSSGDSEGGHKVTFKKKGKVTISCVVNKKSGSYQKGDVVKWTLTIK